jgi:hypothetical protein
VDVGHGALLFDLVEADLDVGQSARSLVVSELQFGSPEQQHPAKLVGGDRFGHQRSDLSQGEAEVSQGKDAVQSRQLLGGVVAVPGAGIGLCRFE